MKIAPITSLFLVFCFSPITNSSATLPHVPTDRLGYKTGQKVEIKHEWTMIAGFKQEEWLEGIIVGDRVCHTGELHFLYWNYDEDYAHKHRLIRKKP